MTSRELSQGVLNTLLSMIPQQTQNEVSITVNKCLFFRECAIEEAGLYSSKRVLLGMGTTTVCVIRDPAEINIRLINPKV